MLPRQNRERYQKTICLRMLLARLPSGTARPELIQQFARPADWCDSHH